MAETIGGGGEWTALRELVAKWRTEAAKGKAKAAKLKLPTQDTKELTEYDTAMEHCAAELEALAAAAPARPATFNEEEVFQLLKGRFAVQGNKVAWMTEQLNKLMEVKRKEAAQDGQGAELLGPPRGGSSSDLAAPSSPSVAEAGFAYADQMRAAFKEWWDIHLRAGGYSPLDVVTNQRIKAAFYAGVSAANRPSLPEAVAGNASAPVGEKRQPSEKPVIDLDAIAREMFDDGFEKCTKTQQTIIRRRADQLKHALAGQPSGVEEPRVLDACFGDPFVWSEGADHSDALASNDWILIKAPALRALAARGLGEGLREASEPSCSNCGHSHAQHTKGINHPQKYCRHCPCSEWAAPAPKPAPPAEPEAQVCKEILRIMDTYHEQEKSPYGIDTPGGLEHMGDVWSLFAKWELVLRRAAERKPPR